LNDECKNLQKGISPFRFTPFFSKSTDGKKLISVYNLSYVK
jgi:hypothetical protein